MIEVRRDICKNLVGSTRHVCFLVYAGGASMKVGEGLGCYSVDWLLALFISRSREDVALSTYGLCSIWWP